MKSIPPVPRDYGRLVSDISTLLEAARRQSARSVNSILTATYWEIGRRIVEYEQEGASRAEYGKALLKRISQDLTRRFGRGFSADNLGRMRIFYQAYPADEISATLSRKSSLAPGQAEICQILSVKSDMAPSAFTKSATVSRKFTLQNLASAFPLSWSQYVHLMAVENPQARAFYESEAIRGGWSVRQLDRQISTQFFERAAHSKNPRALLARGQIPHAEDALSIEDEVRDPYLLEFLDLKDEYSETDLEEALIRHMEWFLLEMGAGFTFVARQKRIRVGDTWYRIDLLLYHRALRCLVIIDLKRGAFSHADAGQMNLYLNYAREHMMMQGETDPIGIILCSDKDNAVVKYATGGIRTQVFASKYLTNLPDEETLRREIMTTQRAIQKRGAGRKRDR